MGNIFRKENELYLQLNDDLLDHCHRMSGLSKEEIQREHARFFHFAEDGHLKKVYLEELLGDHIPGTKWKHVKYLIDGLFAAIDTNQDGSIDFLEYLMSRRFFQMESAKEKADFVFRIIDHNGDNIVTRKELERILECLYDYHQQSTNTNVLKLMHCGVKPAAGMIFDQLDNEKSGSIARTTFIDEWLKDETIRALFTF